MSSEMRELAIRALQSAYAHGEKHAPFALHDCARQIVDAALLARTEAGADGAVAWGLMYPADHEQRGTLWNVAVEKESAEQMQAACWNAGDDLIVPLYTRPQDASGDAVMTGPSDHDDLPAFLEWVAGEVVRRDTRAGNFAEGLAQSLRGRAHILRIVKNDAMQAKEPAE